MSQTKVISFCFTNLHLESTCGAVHCIKKYNCNKNQWWNINRAANNFPTGAGQIARSSLFLLRHVPFMAGQTSITSYHYKSAPSLFTWCLNMKQVNFQGTYFTRAAISMPQEKWNACYNKISITFGLSPFFFTNANNIEPLKLKIWNQRKRPDELSGHLRI